MTARPKRKGLGLERLPGTEGVTPDPVMLVDKEPTVVDAFKGIAELLDAYRPDEQRRILDALYIVFGHDRIPIGKVPSQEVIEKLIDANPSYAICYCSERTCERLHPGQKAPATPRPSRPPRPTAIY